MRKFTALVAIAVLTAVVSIGLVADRHSAAQGPAALRPVPRWEYKTIRVNLAAEEAGQGELNTLGEEGWELSAAVQPERGGPFLILRRPISSRDRPITRRGRGDRQALFLASLAPLREIFVVMARRHRMTHAKAQSSQSR
jgi:hypothetical protein